MDKINTVADLAALFKLHKISVSYVIDYLEESITVDTLYIELIREIIDRCELERNCDAIAAKIAFKNSLKQFGLKYKLWDFGITGRALEEEKIRCVAKFLMVLEISPDMFLTMDN